MSREANFRRRLLNGNVTLKSYESDMKVSKTSKLMQIRSKSNKNKKVTDISVCNREGGVMECSYTTHA